MAQKPSYFRELNQSQRAHHSPRPPLRFPAVDTNNSTMTSGASLEGSDDEPASSIEDEFSITGSLGSAAPEAQVKEEPADPSNPGNSAAEDLSIPAQKRRRVTRACDECRRKKIKCDGQQPCTHCSVYSYDCTYDKPSNRRRNPAPQYIEALENRLQRAEALLRKYVPDADLTDPNLDPAVQQEFRNRERIRAQTTRLNDEAPPPTTSEDQDAKIMTMIHSIGQLDLSEGGEWDFHGTSSGAVFLRRMKEHLRGLLGNDYHTPFLPRPPRPPGMFSLDSPRSNGSAPWDLSTLPNIYDLPPQDKARTLCYHSLNCATCLLRIVHIPTFYEMFDRVYELPPERFGTEETRFLGLLYSVLALGCMYDVSGTDSSGPSSYKTAMDQGLKYYASARLLLQDVAECRELTSLQALLFMLLFLQVTSGIGGCYSFLGIALRSAIRIGLHRHLRHAKITPIEDETRRRCFYVIRQMDTYISAILGFPMILNQEDIDQPLPTEVDDEYITKDAILKPPPETPSFFQAFNAHERLMRILAKVVKYIYPPRGTEGDGAGSSSSAAGDHRTTAYSVEYAKIREIEQDLHDWFEQLPSHWRPSPDGPIEVLRVRTLLRFGYAHVQMMLYRPFLHHASPRLSAGKKVDKRYYACAAAGISVSQNIVHIGTEIMKQTILIGPYWFILYTQFFAILSLVFYVLENPDERGSAEILADARAGRDVIASLAQRSMAADRVTNALASLFEQLPDKLKKTKDRVIPTKKRSAPVPGSRKASGQATKSQVGKPLRRSEELVRSSSGSGGDSSKHNQKTPFGTASFPSNEQQSNQNFSPNNFNAILPYDVSAAAEEPESSAGPGAVRSHLLNYHPGLAPGSGSKSLYGLDDMVFSSGDPFAYPHQQPLMDFANQMQDSQPTVPGDSQGQSEPMQFYLPDLCGDLEADLLGQIPPFLFQQDHGQQNPDVASQMLNMSNMEAIQQPRPPTHAQYLSQQHQHRQHQQQQQQQQQRQQHQRELEDLLKEPNFRGDWNDILGNGGYR